MIQLIITQKPAVSPFVRPIFVYAKCLSIWHYSNIQKQIFAYKKHKQRQICIPKGTIKKRENAVQAAIRETMEETGAIINKKSLQILGILDGVAWYVGVVEKLVESSEKREMIIVDHEEFLQRIESMGNKTKTLMEYYLKKEREKNK